LFALFALATAVFFLVLQSGEPILLLPSSAAAFVPEAEHSRMAAFPGIMLWAWEHPQDLSFVEPQKVGVAFLARTIFLRGSEVLVHPRLQPLRLAAREERDSSSNRSIGIAG